MAMSPQLYGMTRENGPARYSMAVDSAFRNKEEDIGEISVSGQPGNLRSI